MENMKQKINCNGYFVVTLNSKNLTTHAQSSQFVKVGHVYLIYSTVTQGLMLQKDHPSVTMLCYISPTIPYVRACPTHCPIHHRPNHNPTAPPPPNCPILTNAPFFPLSYSYPLCSTPVALPSFTAPPL